MLHGTIFKHPVNIMYLMKFENMLIKMQKKKLVRIVTGY